MSTKTTEQRTVDYTRSGWGHATHMFRWEPPTRKRRRRDEPSRTATLLGHGPSQGDFLKRGDDILLAMSSGCVGRFRIRRIRYKSDPADMRKATVEGMAYEPPNGFIPAGPTKGPTT